MWRDIEIPHDSSALRGLILFEINLKQYNNMATNVKFVEINETGKEMTPEERVIAGELMARFIKRDCLAKPHSKDLFFLVTDYYMSLMYMRQSGSRTAETYHKEIKIYESFPFNWY